MTRITISKDVEDKMNDIKNKEFSLKFTRGLEPTLAFLITDYGQRKSVIDEIQKLQESLEDLIEEKVEDGVKNTLKSWFRNLLSFGEP